MERSDTEKAVFWHARKRPPSEVGWKQQEQIELCFTSAGGFIKLLRAAPAVCGANAANHTDRRVVRQERSSQTRWHKL